MWKERKKDEWILLEKSAKGVKISRPKGREEYIMKLNEMLDKHSNDYFVVYDDYTNVKYRTPQNVWSEMSNKEFIEKYLRPLDLTITEILEVTHWENGTATYEVAIKDSLGWDRDTESMIFLRA